MICDNALVSGFALDRQPVDRGLILEVCADFDFAEPSGDLLDGDDQATGGPRNSIPDSGPTHGDDAIDTSGAVDEPAGDLLTRLARLRRMSRFPESTDRTRT